MPPRLNSEQFQNKVIDFIGERLGIHAYASFASCNKRTQLHTVLLEAASHFNFGSGNCDGGIISKKYGYIPAEKNQYRRTSKYMGKKKKANQLTPTYLQNLEEVIEDNPDLFLDEIRFVFGNYLSR